MKQLDALREECSKYFFCNSIQDSYELLSVYSEFLFQAIKNHHAEPVNSIADSEAKLILQMIFTKTLHIQRTIEGVTYQGKDGSKLNKIIDPTVLTSLIRNLYEMVGMFNIIYRNTKNEDEKIIIYQMWVHAGIKYRHRFADVITMEINAQKYEAEKNQLIQIVNSIEATNLFKNLSSKNQEKIRKKLKEKDFLISFSENEVVYLNWQSVSKQMGLNEKVSNNIYTYFSLYSHPSNVSVFQFKDLFREGENDFQNMTIFVLKYYFSFASVFIADYINLFPSTLKTFNELDLRDQIVINFHNKYMRGEKYSINDSWKALN